MTVLTIYRGKNTSDMSNSFFVISNKLLFIHSNYIDIRGNTIIIKADIYTTGIFTVLYIFLN